MNSIMAAIHTDNTKFIDRLRNQNINPKEDQLPSTTGHTDDAIITRDENKMSENIVSSAWLLDLRNYEHGVVSNMQMHTRNLGK